MRSALAFLALAVSSVLAVETYDSSLNMTIDASTIDSSTRATWCEAQTNTCTTLCDDSTDSNSCTQSTLAWECTCSSNSSTPGLQYYTQTVPTFICEELYSECITENTSSASGQKECKTNIKALCGTLDPSDADTSDSSSTTTGTATASATKSASSATGTSESNTSTSDGLAAPTMAPGKGAAAAVAIGMLAYLV